MNIIAFDTCFGACSAALISRVSAGDPRGGSRCLVGRYAEMETGHAERLMPMLAEILAAADLTFDRVDAIGATVGPGTFTGVRTSIAAARGLALARDLPVFGTTSLAVMAARARAELGDGADEGPIAVCVDARKGELYFQQFETSGRPFAAPLLLSPAAAVDVVAELPAIAVGSGAAAFAGAASARGQEIRTALPALQPDARYMASMILEKLEPPRPLYLRAPDAKPQSVGGLSSA